MSKYDFGYEIKDNQTNEWAFENIRPGSKVLELGAATGVLTKHLYEDKCCNVDIIELDAEAGAQAARYAQTAIIGESGNLDNMEWYDCIEGKRYDYIVILDVLEHLRNPQGVLNKVRECLQINGKILLSVPNLAHNAVLLKLLNDDFPYTELGLLDNTHVHFFTYKTLREMLNRVALRIDKWETVIKAASDTELNTSYHDVSEMQAFLLMNRGHGMDYQYLLTLSTNKAGRNEVNEPLQHFENTYEAHALINGLSENTVTQVVPFEAASMEIDLRKFREVQSVRLVPYQKDALIIGLHAWGHNGSEYVPLQYNWVTGMEIGTNNILFHHVTAFEVNYLIERNFSKLRFEWTCVPILLPLGSKIADVIMKYLFDEKQNHQASLEATRKAYELCDRLNAEREESFQKLNEYLSMLDDAKKQLDNLQYELNQKEMCLCATQSELESATKDIGSWLRYKWRKRGKYN